MDETEAGMPQDEKRAGWSKAERESLKKLLRMALMMLLALLVAGTISALLSSAIAGA